MDKDTVILKHQQEVVAETEAGVVELHTANENQAQRLAAMQEKLSALVAKPIKKRAPIIRIKKNTAPIITPDPVATVSYEELYEIARKSLVQRGIDPEDLSYNDLVTEEELRQIEKELNRALPREEKPREEINENTQKINQEIKPGS